MLLIKFLEYSKVSNGSVVKLRKLENRPADSKEEKIIFGM